VKKTFVVYAGPDTVVAIKAETKEQAFDLFAKDRINDVNLNEEINNFIVNASLFERFYGDEEGSFFDDYSGDYPERILQIDEEKRQEYVESNIEKNIRGFWADKPPFAEEYLREYRRAHEVERDNETIIYTPNFSEEFYIDTIKRIINDGNWYDDFEIVELNFDEKDLQVVVNR
jgi:hypothetical protein